MITTEFEKLKKEMGKITAHADAYRSGGVRVPNIVMNLSGENRQNYVTDYITSVLYDHKLRKFGGLDMALEYRLDGTLKNLEQVFQDISCSAVYTNAYEGIVAMDVSALAEYVNEYQVDYFVDHIEKVSRSATVIIYYDNKYGKKMEIVKKRICETLHDFIEVRADVSEMKGKEVGAYEK